MRTLSVIDLPRPPRITRARCAECATREMPLPPLFFLSDYLWKFNNALPQFFLPMYLDFRYGFVLFRSDVPDYGWTYPDYIPPGELTIPSGELSVNVDGTTYGKMWDSDIHEVSAVDAVSVAELVSVDAPTWTTQDFNSVNITPNHVQRWGYMCLSEGAPYCSVGYDNYISSPQYRTFTQRLNQCGGIFHGYAKRVSYSTLSTTDSPYADECSHLGALAVLAEKLCLKFDTTGALPGATTASLAVYVKCMYTHGSQPGNPVLTLYKYDYGDDVDVGDWAGGELLQTQEITATGLYNLSVSPDDVNIGGLTKLKLSLQQMDSAADLGDCGGWTLEFTPVQVLTLSK